MESYGWSEGISKKTGKTFWACKDGRTQWTKPDLIKEEKKFLFLKIYEKTQSQSFLPFSVKHLLSCACSMDYKDMQHHNNFNVLDVGSCFENKHDIIWKKECCTEYACLDIKPSTYQGNMLAPITWEKIKNKYNIICFYDCLQVILFNEDFEELFKNTYKTLKEDGRIIIIVNKDNYNFNQEKFNILQKLGFCINLHESCSKMLCYIGIDTERINQKTQLDWNLFYLPIINLYSMNEGLNNIEWFYSSQFEIVILQKKSSIEITNLAKSVALIT